MAFGATGGLGWQDTRIACQARGLDLAVLDQDDMVELANEATGAPTPFWLNDGGSWMSPTSCPTVFVWDVGFPSTDHCAIYHNGSMQTAYCGAGGGQYPLICESNT